MLPFHIPHPLSAKGISIRHLRYLKVMMAFGPEWPAEKVVTLVVLEFDSFLVTMCGVISLWHITTSMNRLCEYVLSGDQLMHLTL